MRLLVTRIPKPIVTRGAKACAAASEDEDEIEDDDEQEHAIRRHASRTTHPPAEASAKAGHFPLISFQSVFMR